MNNNATRPYKKQSQYARADSFVLGSSLIMKAIPYGLSQPGHPATDVVYSTKTISCVTSGAPRESSFVKAPA